MMTKKRNLVVILFGMIVALLAFAFGFTQKNTVQATAEENALSATGNVIGASIRYDKDDTSKSGIRFSYVINKSVSGINDLSDIENVGILSNITSTLTGDLTLQNAKINTTFYTDGVASATHKINVGTYDATTKEFAKDQNGDDLLLQIYFYNIPLNTDKATEITSRGYLQINGGELVYSNALNRSIEYVATEAYKAKEYGSDTDFKSFLASCSTFYDVTFETNGGEAVATQSVINGGTMQDVATTRDGYEFVAWTKADGTLVDDATPITEPTTVYANFKKTVADDTVIDMATVSGVEIENVSSATKVMVGDTVLDSSDYTLDQATLTVDKSVLGQGKNAIKVYESDYVYTEYTKTVIDYTKALAFTSLDSQHIVGANYGMANVANTSFVNTTVGNETGNFVKVHVGEDIKNLSIKVAPLYEKSVWEKYSGGTLTVDYYMDVDAFSNNISVFVSGMDGEEPVYVDRITGATARTWNTAEIAVDDILANWDYFTSKDISASNWASVLMHFGWNAFTTAGDVYFGDFTVTPLDLSAPRDFTSLDADHIVGAQYSAAKPSLTSFVNNTTVGGRTGSFVKVNVGSDIKTFALKVAPTIEKATLQKYTGNKLVINYYMDVDTLNKNIGILATAQQGNDDPTFACTINKADAPVKTWNTAEISVDDILANWDYYTSKAIGAGSYASTFMYFGYNGFTTAGDVYFDGFKIVPADYVDVSIPRKFTSLDTTHILAAQYGQQRPALTSVVTDETVGGQTGTFVKVTLDGSLAADGGIQNLSLKVAPTIDKATLEAYRDGKLVINYYIDVANYAGTTIKTICKDADGNQYASSITNVEKQTWQTAEILVQDILENWDFFTGKDITATAYQGVLMYIGSVKEMTGAVYFGGFDIIA